jgi:hypothetical protein
VDREGLLVSGGRQALGRVADGGAGLCPRPSARRRPGAGELDEVSLARRQLHVYRGRGVRVDAILVPRVSIARRAAADFRSFALRADSFLKLPIH